MRSPDLENKELYDEALFAIYPRKAPGDDGPPKAQGIDSYELDEEDRELWREAHRLTDIYDEPEHKSDEFVSTVIHTIN